MAVVSDLVKSGLTVEQQILVNELVILVASLQSAVDQKEAQRAKWKDEKRVQRMSKDVRGHPKTSEDTPSPFPPMINNSTPLSSSSNISVKPRPEEPFFLTFWEIYPRKVGKGAARKAYRNALRRAVPEEILAGARRYAASSPDPEFTKHPSTWLNADCWLDEGKVIEFRTSAPQRTYAEIKAEREAKEQSQ
jgi:hypothetical protein